MANLGGSFQGEPVVISVGTNRIHFFGIGQDGAAMHHFGFNSDTQKYTKLVNLGGSFQSVASAVATSNNTRLDVVALGTNGNLRHRALSEWEDLVVGWSAPISVKLGKNLPERVGIYVVGFDGRIYQTVATVGEGQVSWRNLTWTSMGGDITTAFYRG